MAARCDNYGWLLTAAELFIVPPGPFAVSVKVCGPGQLYGIWIEPSVPMLLWYTPGPSTDTSTRVASAVAHSIVTLVSAGGTVELASGFETRHVTGIGTTENFVKRGAAVGAVVTTTGTEVVAFVVVVGVVDAGALEGDEDDDDDCDEDEDVDEPEALVVVTEVAEFEPSLAASANTIPPMSSAASNTPSTISIILRCRALSGSDGGGPAGSVSGPAAVAGSISVGELGTTGVSTVGSSAGISGGSFGGPVPIAPTLSPPGRRARMT